jgi:hypothetical protein
MSEDPNKKYYKQAKEKQKKFKESEKKLNEDYNKKMEEERQFEYLNSLHPEDSTKEYNPVEHYKKGGLIKGKPKLTKKGWK